MVNLRILRWEIILDYPHGPNVFTKILGGGRLQSCRYRIWHDKRNGTPDWKPLVLKRESGATSQESRWPLEAGKGKKVDAPLELQIEVQPWGIPGWLSS